MKHVGCWVGAKNNFRTIFGTPRVWAVNTTQWSASGNEDAGREKMFPASLHHIPDVQLKGDTFAAKVS